MDAEMVERFESFSRGVDDLIEKYPSDINVVTLKLIVEVFKIVTEIDRRIEALKDAQEQSS